MDFQHYKKLIKNLSIGKKLGGAVYIHIDSLKKCDDNLYNLIRQTKEKIKNLERFNIIKFHKTEFKISFLFYENFFIQPHPALKKSVSVNISSGKYKYLNYSKSTNPPILHRKELLIDPEHPSFINFRSLTHSEVKFGLYEEPYRIGFKKKWDKLIKKNNLIYDGHNLVKNDNKAKETKTEDIAIKRHKTAISRYNLSKPMQILYEYGFISKENTVFDYGCGKGDDLRTLKEMGYNVTGWDPVYQPNVKKNRTKIVNLGFVLNVIEDIKERTNALIESFGLSEKLLSVSCMLENKNLKTQGKKYKDGIITKRGTFQKYYKQEELRNFLETTLNKDSVAIAPGIFFIFQSSKEQQEFISNRNKQVINWHKISKEYYPERAERLKILGEQTYEKHKILLDDYWSKLIDLGRTPNKHEFERYDELRDKIGTTKFAKKLFISKFGEKTLARAFEIRKNELLVYLALSNFVKKVPYSHFPLSIQSDIRTFFKSYKDGMEKSRELLFSIGISGNIANLCDKTNFGRLDHQALYIHKSLINELHPVLRIYVGCAGVLYGDYKNSDLIKIHKNSGKVTFLKYHDFLKNPFPELRQRVKVNLREQRVDVFDHRNLHKQQVLYFKDQYVSDDFPFKEKWVKHSKKLLNLGFNKRMGFGPSKDELYYFLEKKRLTINLNKKRINP
jgi:DNA phosphorothioation-associated putative methyltransferase